MEAPAGAKPAVAPVRAQATSMAAVPTAKSSDSRGGCQVLSDKGSDAKSSSALEA
jgi:hypothetical protein